MKKTIWGILLAGQFLALSAQAAPFTCREQESYLSNFDALFRNPVWESQAADPTELKQRQLKRFLAYRSRDGVSFAGSSTRLEDYVFGVLPQGEERFQFVGAISDFVYYPEYPDAMFGFFRADTAELVGFFRSDTDRAEVGCQSELEIALETGADPAAFAQLLAAYAADQASGDFQNAALASLCAPDGRYFDAFAKATNGFAASSEPAKEALFLSFGRCPDRVIDIAARLDTVLAAVADVNQLGKSDPAQGRPVIHQVFSYATDLASGKILVDLLARHGWNDVGALDDASETVLFDFYGSWNDQIVELARYLLDPAHTNGGTIDVNHENSSGDTALCRAVSLYLKGRADDAFAKPRTLPFIELLVEYGADPTLPCRGGQSPADLARKAKAKELTKLFG